MTDFSNCPYPCCQASGCCKCCQRRPWPRTDAKAGAFDRVSVSACAIADATDRFTLCHVASAADVARACAIATDRFTFAIATARDGADALATDPQPETTDVPA